MKILWVTTNHLDESPFFVSRIQLLQASEKMGDEYWIVANYRRTKQNFGLGEKIKYLPALRLGKLSTISFLCILFIYLLVYIFFKKPDFAVMEGPSVFVTFPFNILSKLRFLKTKFVLDIRSVPVDVTGIKEKIELMKYKFVIIYCKYMYDKITTITPMLKESICNDFRVKEDKIGIWFSGVSLSLFSSESKMKKIRLGLEDKFVVMYHGTLSPNRGLQEVVKAIGLLKKTYPSIVFFILGNGPIKYKLHDLAKSLGLQDNIVLHKPVPYKNIPSYISICDVGILPFPKITWWEVSNPLKLMEYLAMGKPVILTDIAAHRSIVDSNPCATFIESNEPEKIAISISNLYKRKDELVYIGELGRKIIEEKYTWEKQAFSFKSFLEK